MRTWHGITSNHINDCGDGLWEITSLSRACHNLEGSLATHESKFLSENPVALPAAGKGRSNLSVFPRPHAALVEQIRAELASAAERAGVAGTNDTDFVGFVCAASKESPST